MALKTKRYGWRPDLPDFRDHYLLPPLSAAEQTLPPATDLRMYCPPVYDQGQLGSCTANAIAGLLEFDQIKQGEPVFVPSRLQIYYDERDREGTTNDDAGAYLRDGAWVAANIGAAPEVLWPYSEGKFAKKPPPDVYAAAHKFQALQYARLKQDLDHLRGALAGGIPFCFGFTVYESFESSEVASTGMVPMPKPGESVVGGHAVDAVGYDDSSARFICRNSWGDWGQAGYFTMPYEYLLSPDLSDDFWVLQRVS